MLKTNQYIPGVILAEVGDDVYFFIIKLHNEKDENGDELEYITFTDESSSYREMPFKMFCEPDDHLITDIFI